jgi:hypothetical protein
VKVSEKSLELNVGAELLDLMESLFQPFKSFNRYASFKTFQKKQQKPSQQGGPSQGGEVYCPSKSG